MTINKATILQKRDLIEMLKQVPDDEPIIIWNPKAIKHGQVLTGRIGRGKVYEMPVTTIVVEDLL
jgi:hypothetical protein